MSHRLLPFSEVPGSFPARFSKLCVDLARTGNIVKLNKLLEDIPFPRGAIDWNEPDGSNPLHIACGAGDSILAKFLLENGANIEAKRSPDGSAALHIACESGMRRIISCLEAHNPDFSSIRDSDGSTCLHIACENNDTQLVKDLLRMGAEPNTQRGDGCYPVQVAARMGNLEIVEYLITHGSTFNNKLWHSYAILKAADSENNLPIITTNQNCSANFHTACEAGDISLVKHMLELGADVNRQRSNGYYPLHVAAHQGNKDLVILLIEHGAHINNTSQRNYTALLAAVDEKHFEVARTLVEMGAQINIYPEDRDPPHAQVVSIHECDDGQLLLQALLNNGSNDHWRDDDGFTLLHLAATLGSTNYIKCLLKHTRINPGAISTKGLTPLWCAAFGGHREVVQALLKAGVNKHVVVNGETALDVAKSYGWDGIVEDLSVLDVE